MDYFDNGLENVAKTKQKYLEAEYLVFLEKSKQPELFNPIRLEKLQFEASNAWRAYNRANMSIGRTYHSMLGKELHEYIKSKGHVPRRTFGPVFLIATLLTLFSLFAVTVSVNQLIWQGNSSTLGVSVFFILVSTALWIWWSKRETF